MPDYFYFAKKIFRSISPDDKRGLGYKNLEDYGIIGNMETCALISNEGSVDWMCLPHMESESVFAKILDKERGGYFGVQPKKKFKSFQRYIKNTNVLQTFFETETGRAVVTDFMPPFKKNTAWHKHQILFRKIECGEGVVSFTASFQPRFNYAKIKPRIKLTETGVAAEYRDKKIYLDCASPFEIVDKEAKTHFTLGQGENLWLVMQYGSRAAFTQKTLEKEFKSTVSYWQKWAHKCDRRSCVFNGPWHEHVVRSGLVLKLLTHGETGSIAAAATSSLPENIGGSRNWDYRFNWIRDSVFTAQAMFNLGHKKEARELFNWFKRLYKGIKIQDLQILYGMHGEKDAKETNLRHLSGYKNSKPVRIGNAAAKQKQHDVYGELLSMAYEISLSGEKISQNEWDLLKKITDHVCNVWNTTDAGIWEIRGRNRHFVYSKVMCWVALDRAIKIAEKKDFPAPLERWRKIKNKIHGTVLQKGFSKKQDSFVQAFGSEALDAANLLIPLVGFLPFDDPKVRGTIKASLEHLAKNNLVYRYKSNDGLSGSEGLFVLCTFWLIDALALSDRVEKAEKLYLQLLKYISPLGLFAEEIDINTHRQLGNFPQAFSHVGLINSALYIGLAKGKQPPQAKTIFTIITGIPIKLLKFLS